MLTEEKPEREAWPDSLLFWVAITFGVIVVSVFFCAGGLWVVRAVYPAGR